jgi:hypothetical protein
MKSFSLKPLKITVGSFKFLLKICSYICKTRFSTAVSTTPVANLLSVYFAGVVDTGDEFVPFGASILNFVLFTVNYA